MRVLGLDIGDKTIGVAASDPLGWTAQGVETINRTSNKNDLKRLRELVAQYEAKIFVIGLPKNMDGTIGFQGQDCIDFSQKIVGFDIILEDERLTSEEAEERLRARKVDFRKNKGLVDMESACVILEQYLGR